MCSDVGLARVSSSTPETGRLQIKERTGAGKRTRQFVSEEQCLQFSKRPSVRIRTMARGQRLHGVAKGCADQVSTSTGPPG